MVGGTNGWWHRMVGETEWLVDEMVGRDKHETTRELGWDSAYIEAGIHARQTDRHRC